MNPRLLLALMISAPLGCSNALQPEVASVGPHTPTPAAPGSIPAPFVQAGTVFSVQTDEPLDTYYSPEGAPFSATVVNSLFDSSGRILVVPYGAKLRGTIVSVGTYEQPHLRVALQSIDTVHGTVSIEAALREAQHFGWLGPDPLSVVVDTASRPTYAAPWGEAANAPSAANQFGYQVEYGYGTTQPREVRIPRGALIEMALVAPLTLR